MIQLRRKRKVMYPISDEDLARITNSFTYHSPKDNQPERYQMLRQHAHYMATQIMENVPPGRERALAITKLEECIMWANKGIACNENT